jgi:UDP-glucose 4-epimerase
MNILVIGGNGFIGSHLVDRLLLEGHSVRVFDISMEKYRKPLPDVDYRIAALENIPELYEAMLGIDLIFHLASSSLPSTSNVDTINDINKNLLPSLNILNLAVKLGVKRIIYFSSGGTVYGIPEKLPISENSPLNPISSYGIIKSTIESYFHLYQRLFGIQPLILRPSNPFGPRQGHFLAHGVVSTFLRKIKNKEKIIVYGDGSSSKDYIYIKDLIELCYSLSISSKVGVFNLGTGNGISIIEIIQIITELTGYSPEIDYSDFKDYDVPQFVLDISKVTGVYGNMKFTPLKEGIKETWDWLQTNS